MNLKMLNCRLAFFVLMLFLVWFPNGLNAQNWGGGLALGFVAAQIDGDGLGGYKKGGLHTGFYAWYDFSDKIFLQPEVLFVTRGARDASISHHQRMTYIDVPIILGIQLSGDDFEGFRFHVGPSIGYLLNAIKGMKGLTDDNSGSFKDLDYGFHLGFEYKLNQYFAFNLRHSMGFFFLENAPTVPAWRHRYISFAIRVGIK